jgi:hypothetical protein
MAGEIASPGEGLNYIDQQVAEVEADLRARIEAGEVEFEAPIDEVVASRGLVLRRSLERKQSILVNDYRALMARYRQGQ